MVSVRSSVCLSVCHTIVWHRNDCSTANSGW